MRKGVTFGCHRDDDPRHTYGRGVTLPVRSYADRGGGNRKRGLVQRLRCHVHSIPEALREEVSLPSGLVRLLPNAGGLRLPAKESILQMAVLPSSLRSRTLLLPSVLAVPRYDHAHAPDPRRCTHDRRCQFARAGEASPPPQARPEHVEWDVVGLHQRSDDAWSDEPEAGPVGRRRLRIGSPQQRLWRRAAPCLLRRHVPASRSQGW